MNKILFFNSGKKLLTTLRGTEKSTLKLPSINRKHNVKEYTFHTILNQLRFQDNFKHFRMENFYAYMCILSRFFPITSERIGASQTTYNLNMQEH